MQIWRNENVESFTPPGHFGGLKVSDIVPFAGRNFSVQVSTAPPGGGGDMHHHDDWAQVFYVMDGQLTFDTGKERFTLHAGQGVLLEPGDPHYTLNEGDRPSVSLVITVQQ